VSLFYRACHPRGADRIAAAVHTHALNRVVLASCVCCPLEFQCISCNDQRNRARHPSVCTDLASIGPVSVNESTSGSHLGTADSSERCALRENSAISFEGGRLFPRPGSWARSARV